MASSESRSQFWHGAEWAITCCALALAVLGVLMAYYVLVPRSYDGAGKAGLVALMFAPQLLGVTAIACLVALAAQRLHLKVAVALSALAALVSVSVSLWATLAMERFAQRNNAAVSIATALVPQLNLGGPQPQRTRLYGTAADGTALLLDVWPLPRLPAGRLHPAIVRVHGGGWIHGARGELGEWNRWLNQIGYAVFDVEYRLPPPQRWRDEVGDVKCALGWVAAHAEEYQLDATRISVMGYSAGGHLAMIAAYSVGDPSLPPSCPVQTVRVRSVVNLYGPSDLPRGYDNTGSPDYVHEAFRRFIGGSPTQFPERYRILSPVNHVSADTPPTISFLGTRDRIVDQGQASGLAEALSRASVEYETYLLPGSDHGFDANWSSLAAQFTRVKVQVFLHKHG